MEVRSFTRLEVQALRERAEGILRYRPVVWPGYENEALMGFARACDRLDAVLAREEHDAEAR